MAGDGEFERASWRHRSREFGELWRSAADRRVIVAEFLPVEGNSAEWTTLRATWLELEPHDHILATSTPHDIPLATASTPDDKLLLRYAALDWGRRSVDLTHGPAAVRIAARWGAQLASALAHVWDSVLPTDAGRFLRPLVLIDLVGDVRLAFLPVTNVEDLPENAQQTWPRCNERAAIYVVGKLIAGMCSGLDAAAAAPLAAIISRCTTGEPSKTYGSLAHVTRAFGVHTNQKLTEGNRFARAWAEQGIGWLEFAELGRASAAFQLAIDRDPGLRLAHAGLAYVQRLLAEPPSSAKPRAREQPSPRTWASVVDDGRALEAERAFADALALYLSAHVAAADLLPHALAVARCGLAVGETGIAIDYARRAIAIDTDSVIARAICTRAFLLAKQFADALGSADDWLAVAPDDADAHYLRGRALLALGRPVEAREAFDRAAALRPTMLEAFLLGHQTARLGVRTAAAVGTPRAIDIEVPAHLAALREALVAGRTHDVIPVLESPEHAADGVAQLVLAECLAFERRFEEALAVYDRAAALSPELRGKAVIGKVCALIALERAVDAVAVLDAAGASGDLDVAELRARALERLGLVADADRELARVVSASEKRSDARVGRH